MVNIPPINIVKLGDGLWHCFTRKIDIFARCLEQLRLHWKTSHMVCLGWSDASAKRTVDPWTMAPWPCHGRNSPVPPVRQIPKKYESEKPFFFRNWLQRSQLEFESQVAGWDDFSGAGSHSCRPRAQFTPVSEFLAHQIKWSLRHPPTKLKLGTQKLFYDILWLRMR